MAQERGAQASLRPPCPRESDPVCVVLMAGDAMGVTLLEVRCGWSRPVSAWTRRA